MRASRGASRARIRMPPPRPDTRRGCPGGGVQEGVSGGATGRLSSLQKADTGPAFSVRASPDSSRVAKSKVQSPKSQVSSLKSRVSSLESRVSSLESRVPDDAPTCSNPTCSDPRLAPTPDLLRPTTSSPRSGEHRARRERSMEPAPEAITGSGCSVPRWPDGVRRSEAYGEGEPLLACISAGDPISRSQKRMVRVSRCVRKESPSPSVWPGGGGASRGGLGSISAGDRISRSAAGCPPQLLSWGLPAGTKLDPPIGTELGPPCSSSVNCRPMPRSV